jgi:N-acetylated-alpha-linked acidic dipeptidase
MRILTALVFSASVLLAADNGDISIRGFQTKDVTAERELERKAQAVPDTAKFREYMEFMAAEPHNAGSPRSKAVAEYILKLLKSWGLDAQIEMLESLMPYPTVRQVDVISPIPFTATLKEPAVTQDPTSGQPGQLPTYNAYAADGDVTGDVVYVNFGVPADYDWLSKQGIEVKGKIVIARYGGSWRGIKPKVAAEHGAIACLIYSDPHEDGYFEGDVYPKGPMRPSEGVQRGSVLDMPLYPGDPLTPGWASEPGARRLPLSEAKTIMKIPVLPLSYADAQPILQQLTGPLVPRDWRGALAITYHAGPGPTRVHIKTAYDWTTRPLYDVIATIPGSTSPAEWVLAGNHHDAWVNGADDPVSGAIALLETARSLAALQKQGWKPRRTIKLAFWDGEEFGLLGSTEWAEKHAGELARNAVAYLNSDSSGKGWLSVGGSHTLENFSSEVASSIQQPGSASNLLQASVEHRAEMESEQPGPEHPQKTFVIGALGAGSDYVAFLDHLGIASMNETFQGQGKSGIYHSVYDSIYWYTHFSDGTFVDGRALAQYASTALMRLGDGTVLPFEFVHFANTLAGYVDQINKEAQKRGHPLTLTAISGELTKLRSNGEKYNSLLREVLARNELDRGKVDALNQELIGTERTLLSPGGLPNREWYKHQIYAPGFYTGYGVKTFPGIREAVEANDFALAQKEAEIVQQCLANMNALVTQAVTDLSGM